MGEDKEGKGSLIHDAGRRLDFGWRAHNRRYRCHIMKCTTEMYIMLLTNITQKNVITKFLNTLFMKEDGGWLNAETHCLPRPITCKSKNGYKNCSYLVITLRLLEEANIRMVVKGQLVSSGWEGFPC